MLRWSGAAPRRNNGLMNPSSAPRARLLTPQETAGEMWRGHLFGAHTDEVNKRFQLAPTVYWSPSERMPLDLFSYSFTIARYLATIVLSSVLVEIVLTS
jgi:hypothetical protein